MLEGWGQGGPHGNTPAGGKPGFGASEDTLPASSRTLGAELGWAGDVGHSQNPLPPTVCERCLLPGNKPQFRPESRGQPPTSWPAISGPWGLPGAFQISLLHRPRREEGAACTLGTP